MFTGEIQRGRSKRPFVIAGISFVLVVALLLIVPMPHTVESTFTLAPISSAELTAPREGTIAEVVVVPGAVVARGSVLAKLDVSAAEQQVAAAEKQLEELAKLAAVKPNPKAKLAATKAEGALKAADAALAKATQAAKGKKTPALAAAEKKQKAATEALEKARAAVGISPEELAKKTEEAKAAIAAGKATIASGALLAPGSGVLTVLALEKGKAVTAGLKLATVDDVSKLKARVVVPGGEAVLKGMGVELDLPQGKKRVLFDADAKDGIAEAEFDNAKGEFQLSSKGAAFIEGTQRSIVSR